MRPKICFVHQKRRTNKHFAEVRVGVTFADVAALDDAKRLLREALVLPQLMPPVLPTKMQTFFSNHQLVKK